MTARRRLPSGPAATRTRRGRAGARRAARRAPRDAARRDRRGPPRHDGVRAAAPRDAALRPKTRAALPRPRRAAFVIARACARTFASCGLSAAGALPEPLQHITDSIAHTLGVPQPHHIAGAARTPARAGPKATTAAPHVAAPGAGRRRHHDAARPRHPRPKTQARRSARASRTARRPASRTCSRAPPPIAKAAARRAAEALQAAEAEPRRRRTTARNTPPGYPDHWRHLAAAAATAQLRGVRAGRHAEPRRLPADRDRGRRRRAGAVGAVDAAERTRSRTRS